MSRAFRLKGVCQNKSEAITGGISRHSLTVKTILILSCITVALAPLLTAFMIFQFSASSIEQQTEDSNNAYLELVINTIDNLQDGMNSLANTLVLNKTYDTIRLYGTELSTNQRYVLTNFVLNELNDMTYGPDAATKAIYS